MQTNHTSLQNHEFLFSLQKDGNIEPPEAKNLPESKLKFEIGIHEQENIDYFNPPSEKLTRLVHLFHIDTDQGNS